MLNRFSEVSRSFGLTISLSTTKALHQPASNFYSEKPSISIDGTLLTVLDSFKYLEGIISNGRSLDREIASRISTVSQALGRLRTRVCA